MQYGTSSHETRLPDEDRAGDADPWHLLPDLNGLWGKRVIVTVDEITTFPRESAQYRARMRAFSRRMRTRGEEALAAGDTSIGRALLTLADQVRHHYAEPPAPDAHLEQEYELRTDLVDQEVP